MSEQFDLHVDEGHGGADGGASGGGKVEDTRNLRLGNEVAALGVIQGWRVTRSRLTDTAMTLASRYQKANAAGADAFVSIHHDWTQGEQAVIFPDSNDSREVASQRLASSISRFIDAEAPTVSRVYADRRGLAVLRGTRMPAVIVEASRVQDDYDIKRMAEGIVRGICAYYGVPFVSQTGNRPVTPAPKPHPVVHELLKNGSGGRDDKAHIATVKHLQTLLNARQTTKKKLIVDGDFGAKTEAAVKAFQRSKKLTVDGIVGRNTWTALHGK